MFKIFKLLMYINIFKAVHDGMDCKQYQQYSLNDANDENSKKTKEWIEV